MSILDTFKLNGKTAVVTGGSGLYGRQMVLTLAQAGAKVYIASRNVEANEENAKKLREEGLEVYSAYIDQSDEASVLAFLEGCEKNGEKIDILVNNAVLRTFMGMADDAENFDKSMRVNATGIFIISRAFGNHMAKNKSGSIINIGSYMGILGPDFTLYEGTPMEASGGQTADYFFHKGGMENFNRFLASYYGRYGVRSNILNLGGFFNNQNETFVERYSKKTCLGRMANDTDVMGAIVFLASDASAYITGASIAIDGGYSIK